MSPKTYFTRRCSNGGNIKTALDSLAKLFSSRFDGAEFVEYLSQNESGKTLIETMKKTI